MNKIYSSPCLLLAVLILLSIHSLANAFNLPDTGQTLCYDSGGSVIACATAGYTGQDGAYNINPMSYNDNGNGTVTDNNTGLMWQKCSAGLDSITCSGTPSTHNWYQATGTVDVPYNPAEEYKNVCGSLNTLNFAGFSDWRLPAKKELITIVDYSNLNPDPKIATAYFPYTYGDYWSSTTDAGNPYYAWGVYFLDGDVGRYGKNGYYYVRCVRGGQ
jgi:hypothetical protein